VGKLFNKKQKQLNCISSSDLQFGCTPIVIPTRSKVKIEHREIAMGTKSDGEMEEKVGECLDNTACKVPIPIGIFHIPLKVFYSPHNYNIYQWKVELTL